MVRSDVLCMLEIFFGRTCYLILPADHDMSLFQQGVAHQFLINGAKSTNVRDIFAHPALSTVCSPQSTSLVFTPPRRLFSKALISTGSVQTVL